MTWKVLERRAIQIQIDDVVRYACELMSIPWIIQMLVFLDEVSFDNNDMIRKHGFGIKGQRVLFRGEFQRRARVSCLCFVGVNGMLETFITDGTFTRLKFIECCRSFALSPNSPVQTYPGINSIWVLDGAKIHTSATLVNYLRSLGILVIFLPAYCPFFNPIEVVFGWMKAKFRNIYRENSRCSLEKVIGEIVNSFGTTSFEKIFNKCGYKNNQFDPAIGLSQDIKPLGFE